LRSTTLVDAYERRLASGDATILDLNKAKLHQASIRGRVNQAENERQSTLVGLAALNGGKAPSFIPEDYDADDTLPADFETWFAEASAQNPVLAYVRKELEVSQKQLSIDRLSAMPELKVGYMSEIQTVERFRGVTVGLSVPLWSGSNRVKRSRADVAVAQTRQDAAEQAFYQRIQDLYRQAEAMKTNAAALRASLTDTDYRDYLLSALTRGEISMIDYLVENDLYYEALEQTLDAEREYRNALAALKVF
jgi:outer membrane protein TolC